MKNFNYGAKEMIVRKGGSRIFQNWNEWAGISMEDFLEGLKWVCGDPLNEFGRMTRELGCIIPGGAEKGKGTLVKLVRGYYADGSFRGFYHEDTGMFWEGRVSISAKDNI